jgi:hypothetical protein
MKYRPGDLAWASVNVIWNHYVWKLVIVDYVDRDSNTADVVYRENMADKKTLYWTLPMDMDEFKPARLSNKKRKSVMRIFKLYALMKGNEQCRKSLRRIGVI